MLTTNSNTPPPLPPPIPLMKTSLLRDDKLDDISKKPKSNYVSENIIKNLGITLGQNILNELPYEKNGKITFKDLVLHLSNTNNKSVSNKQNDKQIINKQIKILFDMRDKAMNLTKDGVTYHNRSNIMKDLIKQVNTFDKLASIASFNNRPVNKVENDLKVGATRSDNIGDTRFATGGNILEPRKISLTFLDDNNQKIKIKEVEINHKDNTGIGVLSEAINDNYDKLHIKASWSVQSTGAKAVQAGTISNFVINDIKLGTLNDIQKYDRTGRLVASINNLTHQTGVIGSIDARGHLELKSIDGRGIMITGDGADILSLNTNNKNNQTSFSHSNYGKLTLIKHNANDIKLEDNPTTKYIGFSKEQVSESTINLRSLKYSSYGLEDALSIGSSPNNQSMIYKQIQATNRLETTTYIGSARMLDILDSSILDLQKIQNT